MKVWEFGNHVEKRFVFWVAACVEAKTQLLQNVSSLKRNQETANLLARLLPEGGRATRMRRSVSHLSEVLLLGALAT